MLASVRGKICYLALMNLGIKNQRASTGRVVILKNAWLSHRVTISTHDI